MGSYQSLGLYLGDGYIARHARDVYRLRITLDLKYPGIIEECRRAMLKVHGGRVQKPLKIGCLEVSMYWKHWPCLFPQHGVGPKHTRPIVLEGWQRAVALVDHPDLLLRGLIHSDGCRIINNVKVRGRWYAYSRYHFTNHSYDIHAIFIEACNAVGVSPRFNNRWNQSIARRPDVEIMDRIVGPKY